MHADGSCHGSSLVTTVLLFFFFSHSFRGFNEALNGLADDGWSVVGSDGVDDVCVSVSSSPSRVVSCNATFSNGPVVGTGSSSVLCAKASMLLQVSFAAFALQLESVFLLLLSFYLYTLSEHSASSDSHENPTSIYLSARTFLRQSSCASCGSSGRSGPTAIWTRSSLLR